MHISQRRKTEVLRCLICSSDTHNRNKGETGTLAFSSMVPALLQCILQIGNHMWSFITVLIFKMVNLFIYRENQFFILVLPV